MRGDIISVDHAPPIHDWQANLTAKHIPHLRGLTYQLVHCHVRETSERRDDGPHANRRGANCRAHEPGFRKRGVNDSIVKFLRKSACDAIYSAADALAH